MNKTLRLLCSSFVLCGLATLAGAQSLHNYQVGPQPNGSTVVTTNQVVNPAGTQISFLGRAMGVAISPDQKTAAVLNNIGKGCVEVINLSTSSLIQDFAAPDGNGAYDGITYSADGTHLYVSRFDGRVTIANVASDGSLTFVASVSIPQDNAQANPGGLALSGDGSTLYVAMNLANALGIIDVASATFKGQIAVGNVPHSVAVVGGTAYVTNEGGNPAKPGQFTNNSSGTPIISDPNTGAANTGSVSVVDLASGAVTQNITVGLHPGPMLVYQGYLIVANTNSDSLSIIKTATNKVVRTVHIQPYFLAPFGSSPNGLAVTPNGELLVTLGTANAVAFFNLKGFPNEVAYDGLVPTAWYPTGVQYSSATHQLIVSTSKGLGVGVNDPVTTAGPDRSTNKTGRNDKQYVAGASLIPYPTEKQLKQYTAQVAENNGWNEISKNEQNLPRVFKQPSPIKHVIYLIKENRTYDQVLGDDARGNGDINMNQFPQAVTPNQHALADDFVLLDNFYDSGVLSADGHQWTDQAFDPDYEERAFGEYFHRSYPYNGGDSMVYAPSGFIWDKATKHGKTVRIYGEYASQFQGNGNFGNWTDWYNDSLILEGKMTGTLHAPVGAFYPSSDIPSINKVLSHDFPPFDTEIPDQYRLDIFLRDFASYVKGKNLPNLIVMTLPDDHTSGISNGLPTPAAQVADNDLAVGRLIDAVSHSPYWASTAVFVVEDDPQDGVDHVDGHRSTAFVVSPYVKRKQVNSTYYTQLDIVRSIEDILGLPPMNQMDLAAPPMSDVFTDTPDLTPFTALQNQIPLDTLTVQTAAASPMAKAWMAASSKMFPHGPGKVADSADENVLNRAIWYGTKGFNTPYPGDSKVLLPEEVRKPNDTTKKTPTTISQAITISQ